MSFFTPYFQAANGVFSLSANQINITQAIFTMHSATPRGMWFHRRDLDDKKPMKEEPTQEDIQLDVEDYEIIMNPQLIAETNDKEYAWEYSPCFPGIRSMIKRPIAIKVSYLNHEGDEIESEFHDFKARVFLHQLDHINGRLMSHWRLSEGNLDIIDGH